MIHEPLSVVTNAKCWWTEQKPSTLELQRLYLAPVIPPAEVGSRRNRGHRRPPALAPNFKPGILASNPASLRALACHSAPLRFKPVRIECNMWGCYAKTVDPPLECCGIRPPCTSCSLELCDSTCAYSVWGWNKNRITFPCTAITKTWMWFGHMGFSYCGGAI